MAKLVVLKQGSAKASYELKAERTTVGRMEDNAFQIEEPSVSSHHCEVVMKGNEFRIKDLDSTNGTKVNGKRVRSSELSDGDELQIGHTLFRFLRGTG